MVGFGEDPGPRPDPGGADDDSDTGGPPEDDSPPPDFPAPDRSPPEDDGFEPPDRDGPPEDSGEEGDRLDDVTPSPDPGLGAPPEDDNDGNQFDRPDRRGPSERQEQREVAREVEGVTVGDIQRVDDDGSVTLTESGRLELARDRFEDQQEQARRTADIDDPTITAGTFDVFRERQAREQFEQRRERARQTANVDDATVSDLGTFDSDDLDFEATEAGVRVSPPPQTRRSIDPEANLDAVTRSDRAAPASSRTDPGDFSIAGDGPLASVGIPGTDRDLGGTLDAGARGFEERVTDPIAGAAAETNRQDGPFFAGSPGRAQLAEDFTRSAVGAANVPGAAAIGVRAIDEANIQSEPAFPGGPVMLTGAPERTERQAEVGREAAGEAGEFAAENPGRAGAFVAGGVLGGLGAGAAVRGVRLGARGAASGVARAGRSIDIPTSSTTRRIGRDLDDIEVETTTDPDVGRIEIDGTPASEAVSNAAGRANNPGSTTSSRGVFGRPTGSDSGNTPVSEQVGDLLDRPQTINVERSRQTFGRPAGSDSGNTPVSQEIANLLDEPDTINLQRSRRTFGRPVAADTGNRPLSDVLAELNDPADLTGSRGTFGRPLSTDTGSRALSDEVLSGFREANDPGDLTSSRGVFGRPLASDTGSDGLLGGPTTLDARRSRAAFGRPLASDTGNTPLLTRAVEANDPGDLTSSRGVFGRPIGPDSGDTSLSSDLLETFGRANDPGDLTSSSGVFGRPVTGDTDSFGFSDLLDVRGIRISTGRSGRRTVDVEDLEGPDPSEGTPLVQDSTFELDADAGAGSGAGGRIDTTVDLGDGQVARVRQRVDRPRSLGPDLEPTADTSSGPFALGVGAGALGTGAEAFDAGVAGGSTDQLADFGTTPGAGAGPVELPTGAESVGVFDDSDVGPALDTDTTPGTGAGTDEDTQQRPFQSVSASSRVGIVQPTALDQAIGPVADTTQQSESVATSTVTNRSTIRPRSRPNIDFESRDGDSFEADIGFGGQTFVSPTQSLEQASEAIVESAEFDNIRSDADQLF